MVARNKRSEHLLDAAGATVSKRNWGRMVSSWFRARYPELLQTPSIKGRVFIAIEFAVITGWLVYIGTSPGQDTRFAMDLTWLWRAGHALLAGRDPYVEVLVTGPYPLNAPFKYPLPAALVGVPFALFPAAVAAAMFTGVSVGLFVFAVTRRSYTPLWVMISACAIVSLVAVQLDFLLVAGALIPALGFVLAAKPTLGLALFAWRPRVATAVGCFAVCILSFAILPRWPLEWLEAIRSDPVRSVYVAPIAQWYGGPLLALSALRWRRSEARLLLTLACVPHAMLFYDELVLMLVGSSAKEYIALSLCSALGWTAEYATRRAAGSVLAKAAHSQPFVIWSIYIPSLILILRRSNIGSTGTRSGPHHGV